MQSLSIFGVAESIYFVFQSLELIWKSLNQLGPTCQQPVAFQPRHPVPGPTRTHQNAGCHLYAPTTVSPAIAVT
jgi:hypothetical protein